MNGKTPEVRSAMSKGVVVALVLATMWALNPWRGMPLEDDWAYARTVEHLIASGRYELHPWLSANMPFQAYWGAMFATLLGPGFGALRISTLVLSGVGLWAFYRLLRDGGRSEVEASLGVLLLWSSPLYLRFSFNFMTDVPFTALMLLSIWLYGRAWARMSYGWMAAGALAGAAAILTRQFGVALIPALLFVGWRRRSGSATGRLLALAVSPLVVAAAYQVSVGLHHATWAQRINLQAQVSLLSNGRALIEELLWRPGVVVQYLCLFTLPLMIATAGLWTGLQRRSPGFWRICAGVAAVLGISLGISLISHKGVTLPSIPWNLEELADTSVLGRRILTVAILLGSVPYAAMAVTGVRKDLREAGDLMPVLFHGTMLCLLLMTLTYQQFGDEYLIIYVPWVIWTIGRIAPPLRSRAAVMTMGGLVMLQLGIAAIWVEGILTRNQVQWQAAEQTVERLHVPPAGISAHWTWAAYHDFDDYASRFPAEGQTDFRSLFDRWLPDYRRRAGFRVVVRDGDGPALPADVMVVRRRTISGRVIEGRAERAGFDFLANGVMASAGGVMRKAVATGGAAGDAEYTVPVPSSSAVLSFDVGIPDPAAGGIRARLVTFQVLVNGAVMWRQEALPGAWRAGSIELDGFAGSTVKIRFASNGPGAWSAPAITFSGN